MPSGSSTAPRVLLVNDDVSVSDTLSRLLRLQGFAVWAALSAAEGLTLAKAHQPDAVIVDLRAPLSSGLAFVGAMRNLPGLGATPAAIVTGDYYLDEGQRRHIQALGAELRYKPFWLNELVSLTHELLRVPVED